MNDDFMLWYNGSNESLGTKVKKAVEFYEAKYGRAPDAVDVCPQEIDKDFVRPAGLVVRPNVLVVPGHLFVGMEE